MQDEHAYLASKGVVEMMDRLVRELAFSQPDNVVEFAIQHLLNHYPTGNFAVPSTSVEETSVLGNMPIAASGGMHSRLNFSMMDESMMEPEESFLIEDSMPMLPPAAASGFARRGSVSATPIKARESLEEPVAIFAKTPLQTMHLLHDVLPKLWVTASLDEEQSLKIVQAFEPLMFECGDVIVTKGESASWYFVVEQGCAEITESGGREYMPGEGFGELALLYNEPYQDTVISAESNTLVWRLDRNTFRVICMKGAMERRSKYSALVGGVSVLQGLTSADLVALADVMQTRTLVQGQDACVQGAVGTEFFIVQEGELEVTEGTAAAVLGEGAFFGEVSLLPRTTTQYCTVRVTSPTCKLLVVKRSVFFRTLSSARNVLPALEKHLAVHRPTNNSASENVNRNSSHMRKLKQALI
ncbi:hypothetical protein BASA81_011028 [Batrachochytrium salamandrivorans]|nr:hypothetical protein BASA81_011028 [Batrachochytrium salamandrivorans]